MGKRSKMMMPQMMPMMGGMPGMQMVVPSQDPDSSSDEDTTSRKKKSKTTEADSSGIGGSSAPVDPEGPGYHRGKKYCKTIDAVITRSASSIKSLGKCRLGQAVEWLQECLDATMVADLSSDGLLILLWLLCRVKPNVQICSLRYLSSIKYKFEKYLKALRLIESLT